MQNDEQAVRDMVARWNEATAVDDVDTVLSLIAEDAVFLVAGRPPFGKEAFAETFRSGLEHVRIKARAEVEDLYVAGDLAYLRNPSVGDRNPAWRWDADSTNRLYADDTA
jgi:uncharacterized protein (TIGR02246 family)